MNKHRTEEWRREFNRIWRELGVIQEISFVKFSKILNISFRKQVAHTDFRKTLREMED